MILLPIYPRLPEDVPDRVGAVFASMLGTPRHRTGRMRPAS